MPCPYYNEEKESVSSGIYCNKIDGRPGVKFWRCYCNHRYTDCPYYSPNASDPYGLGPYAGKKQEEPQEKKPSYGGRTSSDYYTNQRKQDTSKKSQDPSSNDRKSQARKVGANICFRATWFIGGLYAWTKGFSHDSGRFLDFLVLLFGIGLVLSLIFKYLFSNQQQLRNWTRVANIVLFLLVSILSLTHKGEVPGSYILLAFIPIIPVTFWCIIVEYLP